ncbi:MAG: hypothetical protein ACO21B_12585, partial [Gemmobacter sp.]
ANGNNIPECCEENAVCATCAAADLIPAHEGPALGARLAALEARWIASGFTLTREALLESPPDDA